jgi:drug/metabolite transporter (DMT)-like permease
MLLVGYVFQAGALDRGRLSVIQPLLVSSVVFVLPLGYLLTRQHVSRREVWGAAAIVVGLGSMDAPPRRLSREDGGRPPHA